MTGQPARRSPFAAGTQSGRHRAASMPQKPSQRLRKAQAVYKANRQIALERDGHCCVVCGAPATATHHRVFKQAGGDSRHPERMHAVSVLASVCAPCHDRAHAVAAWAWTTGLRVPRDADIEQAPILYHGRYVRLRNDGSING